MKDYSIHIDARITHKTLALGHQAHSTNIVLGLSAATQVELADLSKPPSVTASL